MTVQRVLDPSLGAPFQPAPGCLVTNATRIELFARCPRQYFLRHLLKVTAEEDDGPHPSATLGLNVHSELFARHRAMAHHDDDGPVDPYGPGTDEIARLIGLHAAVCPRATGAVYLGGELDLRWFVAKYNVLLTGRVDALWEWPDGTVEVRDYKTGPTTHNLDDDTASLLYALLVRAQPSWSDRPVRVSHEQLRGAEARVTSVDITDAHLRAGWAELEAFAHAIRRESTFAARPSSSTCTGCGYRRTCPAAIDPAAISPAAIGPRSTGQFRDVDLSNDDDTGGVSPSQDW